MTHRIELKIAVDLERTEGKFASRDEMVERLTEELETANPTVLDGLGVDGVSVYEITEWEIEEIEQPKPARRRR